MKLDEITGEIVSKAMDVYLQHAYKDPAKREKHRIAVDASARGERVLGALDDISGAEPGGLRAYAMRLGNQTYPHMKLAIVEAYFPGEFFFAVDRHDTFHFEPDVPGYQAWCELKEINRFIKQAIEDAWYRAGIHTLRKLRETRFGHGEVLAEMKGRRVLILDDDDNRAAILASILNAGGYETARLRAYDDLFQGIEREKAILIVMDVSFHTAQGPRIAGALKLDARTQNVPIVAIYSRLDFGPDPEIFEAALRRPFAAPQLVKLVEWTLIQHGEAPPRMLR